MRGRHDRLALGCLLAGLLAAGACSAANRSAGPSGDVAVRTGNPSRPVTLRESGSSLVLPFLQEMVDPLRGQFPNVVLAPSAGGSGKGLADAIAGTAQVGGSDAYLSDELAGQNLGLLGVPIAVSGQSIVLNLPGVPDLRLTGAVLARIYLGHIARWDDPAIATLNAGVRLPALTIVPVRRLDSSGDTFLFTSHLSRTDPEWRGGPGAGTTVAWPALPAEVIASGNASVVDVCGQTPGCVAYVGVSFRDRARAAGLGEALLQNAAGAFVRPDVANLAGAVAAVHMPADLRVSLVDAPGPQAYPIANFEYVLVHADQPDRDTALAIRTFIAFAIDPGLGSSPANLRTVNFAALPADLLPRVTAMIARIRP